MKLDNVSEGGKEMKHALLYKADGSVRDVVLPDNEIAALESMQHWVGGWIELVPSSILDPEVANLKNVFVNEEGKLQNLPVNQHATMALGSLDVLVGNVLVLDKEDSE